MRAHSSITWAFRKSLEVAQALRPASDRSVVFPLSCRKNNVFEFVSEHHLNFPGELLSKVSGENIFKDENVVVSATLRAGGDPSLRGCERGGM